MAVRPAKLMEERVKEMLLRDNTGVGEGFTSALSGDLARVLGDYFEVADAPVVALARGEGGGFEITVRAKASGIKRFGTTEELHVPDF